MPSFRTTLFLLAACLGCGMLLWVLNRSDLRAGRPASGASGSLFPAPLRETDYLMIERNGYRAELQRGAEGWMITHPLSAYASQSAVQRLLDSLERAPLRARIEAHELALRELTLADFGLLKPQARLVVAGPRARAELMLGHLTGTSNELFAGFMHSGDVLLTDPALLSALPASPFALSDSSFFRGERRRINAIGLRRPGQPYLKLAREPGGWMITQPLAARADETAVATLLDALEEAHIARFVWPAPDRPDDAGGDRPSQLSRFGLAEESEQGVQLQFWMAGDPVGRRIRLGTPVETLPGHVHALAEDGPAVVAVTNTLYALARQPVAALRDKRILVFVPDALDMITVQGVEPPLALRRGAEKDWELTSPVAGPAESGQVAILLEALLALRAAGFEPADPAAVGTEGAVQVDLAGRAAAWRLVRAGGSGVAEATVRISLTNEAAAYQVPTSQWARVDALLRCPAAFRSRTLVRLPAEGIRRLAVKWADGTQETVEREGNAGASWRSSAPDRAINRVALDSWLQQLAHLRASRIASLGTDAGTGLDLRGFDAPQVEVTIDLTAQDRLRRILIVGGPAPGGGRLAMVKGDDTVFVLDAETCLLLEQSFLLPVEPRVPDIDAARSPQPETM